MIDNSKLDHVERRLADIGACSLYSSSMPIVQSIQMCDRSTANAYICEASIGETLSTLRQTTPKCDEQKYMKAQGFRILGSSLLGVVTVVCRKGFTEISKDY